MAMSPARCACNPAGRCAPAIFARSAFTRSVSPFWFPRGNCASTTSSSAWPSEDRPRSLTLETDGTLSSWRSSAVSAVTSALGSGPRDGLQVAVAERRGQRRGVLARRARRQERAVVALGDARQRGQREDRDDRPHEPCKHDQPAEPDSEAPDGAEDRVDMHGTRWYATEVTGPERFSAHSQRPRGKGGRWTKPAAGLSPAS